MANALSLDIRLARVADARQMARMSRQLVEQGLPWRWRPERIRCMMRRGETTVLVAETGGSVRGFAIFELGSTTAHLDLLAVNPDFRRQGIAGQLLAWLETSCRVAGMSRISLEVRQRNEGAINFYQTCGYTVTGQKRGYYQGRENAVLMCHQLIPSGLEGRRP